MTKQWLTRRAVRSPVSRLTTAPISSSVCRLPFISASALPSRTSSTALSAESWLCARVDDRQPRDVDAVLLRDRLDPRARTDQDRRDQAELRRVDGAAQRALVAGMRDGGRRGRQRPAEVEQPLVLLVLSLGCVVHACIASSPCRRRRARRGGASACHLPCGYARFDARRADGTSRTVGEPCRASRAARPTARTLDSRSSVSRRSTTVSSRSRSPAR